MKAKQPVQRSREEDRKLFKHKAFQDYVSDAEFSSFMSTLGGSYRTREELIVRLGEVRRLDVVQTVVDTIVDDGFSSFDSSWFEVIYGDKEGSDSTTKKVNSEIEAFLSKMNVQSFVQNLFEDFLVIGEYPFRTVVRAGEGVVEIVDDVSPETVLALYKSEEPRCYFEREGSKVVLRSIEEISHFVLAPRKLRIKVDGEWGRGPKELPQHIRMGRSILYSALSRLKQLQLMEMTATATALRKILSPDIVSVGVPENMDPKDVKEMCEKYEKDFRGNIPRLKAASELSIDDLFELAGRVKVLPPFASAKGNVGRVEVGDNRTSHEVFDERDKLRYTIAMAIGFPPYYVATQPSLEKVSRLEMLKIYSRYTRRLKAVQDSVASGVKSLVKKHIDSKIAIVSESDINVKFKSIINVDMLDWMEYVVAGVETVNQLNVVMENIDKGGIGVGVNKDEYSKLLSKLLGFIGGSGKLLRIKTAEEMAPAPQFPFMQAPTEGKTNEVQR